MNLHPDLFKYYLIFKDELGNFRVRNYYNDGNTGLEELSSNTSLHPNLEWCLIKAEYSIVDLEKETISNQRIITV